MTITRVRGQLSATTITDNIAMDMVQRIQHHSAFIKMLCSFFRYSLPVNFQAVVMKPHRKAQKKLGDCLRQLYGHLDANHIAIEADVSQLLRYLVLIIEVQRHVTLQLILNVQNYNNPKGLFTSDMYMYVTAASCTSFYIIQNIDLPGLSFGQQDYHPYVCFKVNLNLLGK